MEISTETITENTSALLSLFLPSSASAVLNLDGVLGLRVTKLFKVLDLAGSCRLGVGGDVLRVLAMTEVTHWAPSSSQRRKSERHV